VKKYFNTVSAFQFYQVARYATLILTGIVLAKSALSQSEIGQFETFVFVAGSVSFFWLSGLQKALLPLAGNESNDRTHFFSSFVVIQILSIVAAIFLFTMQPLFSKYLLNGKFISQTGMLMAYIVLGVPANLTEYYYLIRKRKKAIVVYGIISFSVQFICVALPAILGLGIKNVMLGLVASSILRYVWLCIVLISNGETHFSLVFVKEHVALGGPLVLATLLSGSAEFVDGFIVTAYFDEETFAIFRYGARELPLSVLMANALSNAMLPDFAKKEQLIQNLATLKKGVQRLIHFLFPLTAVMLLLSHPVFPIFFNPKFEQSATIFNIYLLLIISRVLLPQSILNGFRITKPIVMASFFELAVNIGLSLLFVKFMGLPGVALATFAAYLFEKVYLVFAVKRELKIKLTNYLPIRPFIFYSATIILIFIIVEFGMYHNF